MFSFPVQMSGYAFKGSSSVIFVLPATAEARQALLFLVVASSFLAKLCFSGTMKLGPCLHVDGGS